MNSITRPRDPITVPALLARKAEGPSIAALTAYDFTTASLLDQAGVDVLLVGDSMATVIQGLATTLPVTMDEMTYHCRCVSRAVARALVVGDLPFMSYQCSADKGVESAGRLLKEGGVAAVKLEGGVNVAETIRRIVSVDIPVVGHVGLTPQSYHRMGGYRKQGTSSLTGAGSRESVLQDALAVEDAGAFMLVVECIPAELAAEITGRLSIPVIGIGSGAGCDGQILVTQDMLGLTARPPGFVKKYAEIGTEIVDAAHRFVEDTQGRSLVQGKRPIGPEYHLT